MTPFPNRRARLRVALLTLLRFVIALVQMAGLIAYFHQHLDWGLLPTALVALLLTLLVPIAATIFGFMGAIYAWAWPWWLAFLVFLPGLAMALTAIAGVGILGALSAFLMKRLGVRRPQRGPFAGRGQMPPEHEAHSGYDRGDNASNRGSTIEGEVISSRVEPDGK